jgi:hypothetical protein
MRVAMTAPADKINDVHNHLLWLMGHSTYSSVSTRPEDFATWVAAAQRVDGTRTMHVKVHSYCDKQRRTGVSMQMSMMGQTFLWVHAHGVPQLPPPPEEGVRDYELDVTAVNEVAVS